MSGRRTTSAPAAARVRRLGAGLAACALVGVALPLTGGAHAAPAPAAAPAGAASVASAVRAADPEFAGYAASTTATPLKIEIFEQTIPVPASPQAELSFGYSVVKADSSTTRGRASYLWPGDAVGEGFKTIAEAVFPPEIAGPLAENGYPVQVNSAHPAGPKSERSEQFPGTIQRTSASAEKTTAASGYSTDCRLGQPQPAEEGEGGGGDGGGDGDGGPIPGLPDIPLPGLGSLMGELTSLAGDGESSAQRRGERRTDATSSRSRAPRAEEEAECLIPAELAALVDVGGFGATSTVTRGADDDGVERVRSVSRSVVGEISLLGGTVTLDGIVATALVSSDGAKATVKGVTDYGTLTIAGTKFRYGSDGFEANGETQQIPGLPADPNQALEALGVQLLLPQPTEKREGDKGTVAVGGLQIILDTTVLRTQLANNGFPFAAITEAINGIPFPEEANQLKSALGAAVNLSPKFVITLGNAFSTVDTSPEIEIPPFDPGDVDNDPTSPVDTGSGTGSTGGVPASGGDAPLAAGGGAAPSEGGEPAIGDDGALTDAGPVGAGLPELFSIPGALFFGGILGATILGSYLRRLGILALGGGANCAMGLQAGLPDLRKA